MSNRAVFWWVFGVTSLCLGAVVAQEPSETTETYGSWMYRCVQPQAVQGGDTLPPKICEINQTLSDANGSVVGTIAIGPNPDGEGLVSVFRVPQGTLLSYPVNFGTEDGEAVVQAQYFTCMNNACFARVATSEDVVVDIAEAEQGRLLFADRSGRVVQVLLSLSGLKAALGRLL